MEPLTSLLLSGLLGLLLLRLLAAPIRLAWKIALNTAFGFASLWLLGAVAPLTGLEFPINAVTVTVAGFGGLPGLALLALLG